MNAKTSEDVLTVTRPQSRINRVMWRPLNKTFMTIGEDATMPRFVFLNCTLFLYQLHFLAFEYIK